jgi:KDO2-lipid IV(A) lauroyltransferase
MKQTLEYWLVWCVARSLGWLPRPLARLVGAGLGWAVFSIAARLRRTGLRNLELAMPEMPPAERERTLRRLFRNLGWQLAEFCRMERYTRTNTANWIRYEGLETLSGKPKRRARGFHSHRAPWVHGSFRAFYHSLMGHPMGMVIRRLDNRLLDGFVNRIRCLHGNQGAAQGRFCAGSADGDAERARRWES